MVNSLARRLLGPLAVASAALMLLAVYASTATIVRIGSESSFSGSTLRSALQRADRVGLSASQGGHLWDEVLVVNLPHRAGASSSCPATVLACLPAS
jgi:hypothetical protein